MDRANALVHMQVVRGHDQPRGIHWYSKEQAAGELAPLLVGYTGFASQNKRFKWLLDVFALWHTGGFDELMRPILLARIVHDNPETSQAFYAMDPATRPWTF